MNNITINIGVSLARFEENDNELIIDWSFDAVYIKYNNEEWITISLGEKTKKYEIYKIDNPEKKSIFKHLCFVAFDKLKLSRCYSNINNSLNELEIIVDYFV